MVLKKGQKKGKKVWQLQKPTHRSLRMSAVRVRNRSKLTKKKTIRLRRRNPQEKRTNPPGRRKLLKERRASRRVDLCRSPAVGSQPAVA